LISNYSIYRLEQAPHSPYKCQVVVYHVTVSTCLFFYPTTFCCCRKLVKTEDDIQSEKLGQLIRNSVIKMIKKREAAMAGEIDGYGSDFLGQLVKVYRSADMTSRITIDDLIDECKNFYIAGHETTTSALTWIVLMLATHADWQEKVRNEILELFGQQNPSLEGISRLKTVSEINRYSLESNEIYQQLFAIRSCSNYNMINFVFNLFSCR